MKMKHSLWTWLLCGLMAMALVFVTTGCDDDDDRDAPIDPALEDASGDAVEASGDEEVSPESAPELYIPEIRLTAPQLVGPRDNSAYPAPGGVQSMYFEWKVVLGATGYVLTINAEDTPVAGTAFRTSLRVSPDPYEWKVRAVSGDRLGPYSATRTFLLLD